MPGVFVVFQGYMEKIPSHYAVVRSKGTSFISFLPSKIIQVFVKRKQVFMLLSDRTSGYGRRKRAIMFETINHLTPRKERTTA